MPAGVVIDTSFLITLADSNRSNHATARRYWRHFMDNEIPVYLSTVVVSEFYIKQEIPEDILCCCVVLPFNWDDALCASKLDWQHGRPSDVQRDALKDDVKIIAQAAVKEAEFAITDDSKSFHRYCESFRQTGAIQFKCIILDEGFDSAFFEPNGQSNFMDDYDNEESDG